MVLGLYRACTRASDWDLEYVPTAHVDGFESLHPNVNQLIVRSQGSVLDEALFDLKCRYSGYFGKFHNVYFFLVSLENIFMCQRIETMTCKT